MRNAIDSDQYLKEGFMALTERRCRPVLDAQKCINCKLCLENCPDSAVVLRGGLVAGFDLAKCRGCGICAKVCPPRTTAITMQPESPGRFCG